MGDDALRVRCRRLLGAAGPDPLASLVPWEGVADTLALGTSQLPTLAEAMWASPPWMPGRATDEAIAAGVGHGFRGAIVRLVGEAARELGGDAVTILAGGWRAMVRDSLPGGIEIPDIVLCGIALAAGRACAR